MIRNFLRDLDKATQIGRTDHYLFCRNNNFRRMLKERPAYDYALQAFEDSRCQTVSTNDYT